MGNHRLQNQLFWQKNFRNTIRVSTVRIHLRSDILLGLIWVQTVFKGCQQTTLVHMILLICDTYHYLIRWPIFCLAHSILYLLVLSDLGPNRFQRLLADETGMYDFTHMWYIPLPHVLAYFLSCSLNSISRSVVCW